MTSTAVAQRPDVHSLARLSALHESIDLRDEDLRGRSVQDEWGATMGTVTDLIVDPVEQRIRFLQVDAHRILGLGGSTSFVPVAAIARIEGDTVHVTETPVPGAPRYDPHPVTESELRAVQDAQATDVWPYIPYIVGGYTPYAPKEDPWHRS